ncbi:FkbM family methyltransferase [Occallatibacter riparius]|uniref:FkbM family methyltransferase n=1 Tax=Occallatibacter riparius TaxID=1002689 RepID=A0A9J7BSC1_9BACT|nr:FkbM family methyltransferase [Occallatibacter riparius]UWZ85560.1 FkbM family methyltransferase [Occallatibacter riparius]
MIGSKALSTLKHRFPRLWMETKLRFERSGFEPEFWMIPLVCTNRQDAIDIGANMGEFSFLMSKTARQVIAFEPNADLKPYLQRLLSSNCRIETIALSSGSGTASLRIESHDSGGATIEEKNPLGWVENGQDVSSRTIQKRTLDSYDLNNISFIKIDVEGHEESVVAGGLQTLRRNMPVLLIESEDRHNQGAPARLAKVLAEFGYCGFFVKHGVLTDLSLIRREDVEVENLRKDRASYVNNFIFVPNGREDIVSSLKRLWPARS